MRHGETESSERIKELQRTLQCILEGDDEEVADEVMAIIDCMYQSVTGEGTAVDETEMLTRLHRFLMKRGVDLYGL